MSTSTSSSNGTTIVSGPNVIQTADFYVKAGILHPIICGSIAVTVLFSYLRLSSNRSVAPITVFDWIINVALGSTLAGIVNGNSLARGILALVTMLAFQWLTSYVSSSYKQKLEWLFHGPPLVVCFRGEFLEKVMAKHRISKSDIYSALRQACLLNVSLVECVIIESNGAFSICAKRTLEDGVRAEALMMVPAYKALSEEMAAREREKPALIESGRSSGGGAMEARLRRHENDNPAADARPAGASWDARSVLQV